MDYQPSFDIDLDHLDPLFCAWFTGWVDGEGCFDSSEDKNSLGISARLRISARDDDAALVSAVMYTLQCGSLSRMEKPSPQVVLEIRRLGDCHHILIPLFDKYPLYSKKSRDYKIWRALVMALSLGLHLNGQRDYVLDLCRQLKQIKVYDPSIAELYKANYAQT